MWAVETSVLRPLLVLLLATAVHSWSRDKSTSGNLQVTKASLISFTQVPHSTIPSQAGVSTSLPRPPSVRLGDRLVPQVDPFGPMMNTPEDYSAAIRAAAFAKHLRNFELTMMEEYKELIAKGYRKRKNGEIFFTNNNQLPLPYHELGRGVPLQNNILTPNFGTTSSSSGANPAILTPVGRGRIIYFARRPVRGYEYVDQLPGVLRPQLYSTPSVRSSWK